MKATAIHTCVQSRFTSHLAGELSQKRDDVLWCYGQYLLGGVTDFQMVQYEAHMWLHLFVAVIAKERSRWDLFQR
jgi:hypothetical protein